MPSLSPSQRPKRRRQPLPRWSRHPKRSHPCRPRRRRCRRVPPSLLATLPLQWHRRPQRPLPRHPLPRHLLPRRLPHPLLRRLSHPLRWHPSAHPRLLLPPLLPCHPLPRSPRPSVDQRHRLRSLPVRVHRRPPCPPRHRRPRLNRRLRRKHRHRPMPRRQIPGSSPRAVARGVRPPVRPPCVRSRNARPPHPLGS